VKSRGEDENRQDENRQDEIMMDIWQNLLPSELLGEKTHE
jgi:hypothetical protein